MRMLDGMSTAGMEKDNYHCDPVMRSLLVPLALSVRAMAVDFAMCVD